MNSVDDAIRQKIEQEQIQARAIDAITAPYVKSGWKWLLIGVACSLIPVLGIPMALFGWGNGFRQAVRTLGQKNMPKGSFLFLGAQILGLGSVVVSILITVLTFGLSAAKL